MKVLSTAVAHVVHIVSSSALCVLSSLVGIDSVVVVVYFGGGIACGSGAVFCAGTFAMHVGAVINHAKAVCRGMYNYISISPNPDKIALSFCDEEKKLETICKLVNNNTKVIMAWSTKGMLHLALVIRLYSYSSLYSGSNQAVWLEPIKDIAFIYKDANIFLTINKQRLIVDKADPLTKSWNETKAVLTAMRTAYENARLSTKTLDHYLTGASLDVSSNDDKKLLEQMRIESRIRKLSGNKPMELTKLHIAAEKGAADEAAELLKQGNIDIDDQNNGERDTALMIAVREKRWKVAEMLVEAGADIAFCNKVGFNAINIAVVSNTTDILTSLINKCFVKETSLDKLLLEAASAYKQALCNDVRDAIILQLTRRITGFNKAENWHKNTALLKQYRMYCDYMLDADIDHNTSQGQSVKSGQVEPLNPDKILSVRLYIFIELYIKIAIGHISNFSPGDKADVLSNIRKEIKIISDIIINENIGTNVIAFSSEEDQINLLKARIDGIISRLKLMPKKDEFVINSGYEGNPGHAIYIVLHKLNDTEVLIRVDNRYLSCEVVRQKHGKAPYTIEEGGKRYIRPYCVGIFSLDNVQELVSYLAEVLKVSGQMALNESDKDRICSSIYGTLLPKHVAEITDEIGKYINSWHPHPQQTTRGMNCTLSSYNLGISIRHGQEFFEWLKSKELTWVPTIEPTNNTFMLRVSTKTTVTNRYI